MTKKQTEQVLGLMTAAFYRAAHFRQDAKDVKNLAWCDQKGKDLTEALTVFIRATGRELNKSTNKQQAIWFDVLDTRVARLEFWEPSSDTKNHHTLDSICGAADAMTAIYPVCYQTEETFPGATNEHVRAFCEAWDEVEA